MRLQLTQTGAALLPHMISKVRDFLRDGVSPRSDANAFIDDVVSADDGSLTWPDFISRVVGLAIAARFDPMDLTFQEVMSALEDAGFFSKDELVALSRSMGSKLSRAIGFADFYNGRMEEGTLGAEHLHIAVRRAWERLFDTFSKICDAANRLGLNTTSDLFVQSYLGGTMRELNATMPGERIKIPANENRADIAQTYWPRA